MEIETQTKILIDSIGTAVEESEYVSLAINKSLNKFVKFVVDAAKNKTDSLIANIEKIPALVDDHAEMIESITDDYENIYSEFYYYMGLKISNELIILFRNLTEIFAHFIENCEERQCHMSQFLQKNMPIIIDIICEDYNNFIKLITSLDTQLHQATAMSEISEIIQNESINLKERIENPKLKNKLFVDIFHLLNLLMVDEWNCDYPFYDDDVGFDEYNDEFNLISKPIVINESKYESEDTTLHYWLSEINEYFEYDRPDSLNSRIEVIDIEDEDFEDLRKDVRESIQQICENYSKPHSIDESIYRKLLLIIEEALTDIADCYHGEDNRTEDGACFNLKTSVYAKILQSIMSLNDNESLINKFLINKIRMAIIDICINHALWSYSTIYSHLKNQFNVFINEYIVEINKIEIIERQGIRNTVDKEIRTHLEELLQSFCKTAETKTIDFD